MSIKSILSPFRALAPGLLALLATLLPAPLAAAPRAPLTVAAAADLRGVLEELKEAFEREAPATQVQMNFGASGSLTAQIRQGAPYDVFLSADLAYPEQVLQGGLATEEGVFPYAVGSLVLWVRKDLGLAPDRDGLKVLLDPRLGRIAIANARVAPYGRAAEAALRGAGILEALRPRIVQGENVAQAAQYLQTGAADAGLVSFSQAHGPALQARGLLWTVPASAHPPLRQGGVILKASRNLAAARAFRTFLLGPRGQAILARHGFNRP